jgi:hypothetical protein
MSQDTETDQTTTDQTPQHIYRRQKITTATTYVIASSQEQADTILEEQNHTTGQHWEEHETVRWDPVEGEPVLYRIWHVREDPDPKERFAIPVGITLPKPLATARLQRYQARETQMAPTPWAPTWRFVMLPADQSEVPGYRSYP